MRPLLVWAGSSSSLPGASAPALGAERRLPHRDRQLDVNRPRGARRWMWRHVNPEVEVPARAAADAGAALAGGADAGAVADASGDLHPHPVAPRSRPEPPHVGHAAFPCRPVPLHVPHTAISWNSTARRAPASASSRLISTSSRGRRRDGRARRSGTARAARIRRPRTHPGARRGRRRSFGRTRRNRRGHPTGRHGPGSPRPDHQAARRSRPPPRPHSGPSPARACRTAGASPGRRGPRWPR